MSKHLLIKALLCACLIASATPLAFAAEEFEEIERKVKETVWYTSTKAEEETETAISRLVRGNDSIKQCIKENDEGVLQYLIRAQAKLLAQGVAGDGHESRDYGIGQTKEQEATGDILKYEMATAIYLRLVEHTLTLKGALKLKDFTFRERDNPTAMDRHHAASLQFIDAVTQATLQLGREKKTSDSLFNAVKEKQFAGFRLKDQETFREFLKDYLPLLKAANASLKAQQKAGEEEARRKMERLRVQEERERLEREETASLEAKKGGSEKSEEEKPKDPHSKGEGTADTEEDKKEEKRKDPALLEEEKAGGEDKTPVEFKCFGKYSGYDEAGIRKLYTSGKITDMKPGRSLIKAARPAFGGIVGYDGKIKGVEDYLYLTVEGAEPDDLYFIIKDNRPFGKTNQPTILLRGRKEKDNSYTWTSIPTDKNYKSLEGDGAKEADIIRNQSIEDLEKLGSGILLTKD